MLQADELVEDLTDAQREAVTHVDGPLLIVAGAGSGKTRVITRRVAYLIRMGIPAPSILAITFTNKAAGEMKSRISAVCGRQMRDFGRLDQPWPIICTFHSLCLRVLKHYAVRIGLPANFTIFDSADQTKLIKEALKLLDLSSTNFPASTVHGTISNAKNQLLGADAFARAGGDFYQRTVARIYTKYQQLLAQNNALDYDDLLLRAAQAFRDFPDVLSELQERFQYVLIDEYQDTNHAQYVIAHAMALRHRNLCVVGDPDQSIYAWRGADIQNILDFEKDYPDAKVVRLEQNYRSTKRILSIASHLIAHNTQRKEKGLWTENKEGEPASLFLCQDEHDEAQVVTRQLRELNETEGRNWNEMAIFYRMNSLSRVMEDALRRANVPYQIARGVEFYNRKEIKDVLSYLRIIVNPDDEVGLTRIVNVPARGIGAAALRQVSAFAASNGISPWQGMERAGEVAGLSTRAQAACRHFVEMVRRWRRMAGSAAEPAGGMFDEPARIEPAGPHGRVQSIMEDVIKRSGLEQLFHTIGGEEQDELNNVNELVSSAAEYDQNNPEGTLEEYLAMVSLVSDADHMEGSGGAVTLMTLHAAKGLEFPVVAMIGMEDGVLPHSRARGNFKELEEERRLCFVGITRTQERLILTRAAYRTFRGLRERTASSQFLAEIPPNDLRVFDRTGLDHMPDRPIIREPEAGRRDPRFREGQMVRHPRFGVGRIAELSGMGAQTRAVVEFGRQGRKTLILEYAKLELVG